MYVLSAKLLHSHYPVLNHSLDPIQPTFDSQSTICKLRGQSLENQSNLRSVRTFYLLYESNRSEFPCVGLRSSLLYIVCAHSVLTVGLY